MKILLISLSVFLTFKGCESEKEMKTPQCVLDKASNFQACDTGKNVKQYTFQNQTVYVFEPGNCGADMTSEVIDSQCKHLGDLGGIAGNFRINGEDFSNAEFVQNVWED